MDNDTNHESNQPKDSIIPKIEYTNDGDVVLSFVDLNTNIKHERTVRPNGTFEKLSQNGVLIESISKIKNADGGWIETHFNPQGEQTAIGYYQKDGIPKKIIRFNEGKTIETILFIMNDNILISTTLDKDQKIVRADAYNEQGEIIYTQHIKDDKPYQTDVITMREDGVKSISHTFNDNTCLVNLINKEGEGIGEYHYKDNELVRSYEVYHIDDNGYRYVRVWNKEEDPSIVTENIFSEGKCLARRILKDGKYAGFVECVRDATTNRYEVLFNAQGHKVSCSTYNDKNELIEYGVYEDGLYRITNQKLPQKNNSDPRSRS